MYHKKRWGIVVFIFMLSSIAFTPTRAATVTVTDCTSSSGAAGRLAEQITAANDGDTIDFSCGTATISFVSQISLSKSLTFDGGGVITFSGNNSNGIFYLNSGLTVIFNGLTFVDGYSNYGGAIRNEGSTITINNSLFNSNEAYFGGAAIYNAGTLTLNNTDFTNNTGNFDGALMSATGALTTITDALFENNSASTVMTGGAMSNGGSLSITNSIIRNNTSGGGGTNGVRTSDDFFSQNTHYENNGCINLGGAYINQGGNTTTNAPGCPGPLATNNLIAAVGCSGNNVIVNIYAGDSTFNINYEVGGSPMSRNGVFYGAHLFTGPISMTNIVVSEQAGDFQTLPLPDTTCPGSVVIPPVIIPIFNTPAVTVLGCALDSSDGVEVANAPDNTYCRVLMKNGGVVSYSGAVPANLIQQGVILAVDVYRLQGGMSVNTFPDYARICLSGSGRYFYMDGRNAPRYAIEMPTEAVDGMTCAWIPAPGTVILTQ